MTVFCERHIASTVPPPAVAPSCWTCYATSSERRCISGNHEGVNPLRLSLHLACTYGFISHEYPHLRLPLLGYNPHSVPPLAQWLKRRRIVCCTSITALRWPDQVSIGPRLRLSPTNLVLRARE
ncbi:hypothetical protein PLICRDRAFT_92355, partial [Plicaturopsis crispa FD-325 SS-3]